MRQSSALRAAVHITCVASSLLIGRCALASPVHYNISELPLMLGAYGSTATAINDTATVTGYQTTASFSSDAYSASVGNIADVNSLTTQFGSFPQNSYGYAINNSGTIVGSDDASGVTRAFVLSAGSQTITEIGTLPGMQYSEALGINDSGVVVGDASGTSGNSFSMHAFVYSNGTMTDLNGAIAAAGAGAVESKATGINSNGDVTGYWQDSAGVQHAFIYNLNSASLITLPGLVTAGPSPNSVGNAVNASGEVVGSADAVSGSFGATQHAFAYKNGVTTDLGALGSFSNFSAALAVNSGGVVVGTSSDNLGNLNAFVANGGMMYNLNDLVNNLGGWQLQGATGINSNGDIVGYGTDPNSTPAAFLLSPDPPPAVPEAPTSTAMCLLAATGLFTLKSRKR